MYINGKKIVFYGVNRHEFNMRTGRCVGSDDMVRDMFEMKRNNINAVRTSHYPNALLWYDLCDWYGLYMIDETNIETHGTWQFGMTESGVNALPGGQARMDGMRARPRALDVLPRPKSFVDPDMVARQRILGRHEPRKDARLFSRRRSRPRRPLRGRVPLPGRRARVRHRKPDVHEGEGYRKIRDRLGESEGRRKGDEAIHSLRIFARDGKLVRRPPSLH